MHVSVPGMPFFHGLDCVWALNSRTLHAQPPHVENKMLQTEDVHFNSLRRHLIDCQSLRLTCSCLGTGDSMSCLVWGIRHLVRYPLLQT